VVSCGDLRGVFVVGINFTFLKIFLWKFVCVQGLYGRILNYCAIIIAAVLDIAYVWDGMNGTKTGKLYVTVTVT
jgi:hypothetical protein